jgi:glyoxylase-like metal-dependent hydrolase (beta-lactamase superfamily II)
LADSENAFIVDPGFESEKVIDVLEKKKLKPVAILVTHGHFDHITGVGSIKRNWPDCAICIGCKEKDKLTDPKQNLSSSFGFPSTAPAADVLFRDGDHREIAGIPITVRHVPGHSSGHVVYLIETDSKPILFAGDVIFKESVGRGDFPDGDPLLLIDSIRQQILTLPDSTIVYSGHGPKTTVGAERKHNPFLQ